MALKVIFGHFSYQFYNPITDQAEVLKLLNLQHNSIKLLDGIDILRRLVFLDLYDNKIEGMDPQSLFAHVLVECLSVEP